MHDRAAHSKPGGWRPIGIPATWLFLLAVPFAGKNADAQTNRPPDWAGDVAFAGVNAAIGGLTAALFQTARRGDFWSAFRDGAIGGAIAYGGRRIAAENFPGAGWVGREVAAVGTSVVSNASQGRSALQQIVLPLALGRLYLESDSSRDVRFKLDLPTTLATAYFALRSDSHFDASASLSSGMPVFITHVQFADGHWRGSQIAGAIWVVGNPDDPSPDASQSSVLAHERVHVLQYDFTLVSWSGPAEDWLSNRYPSAAWALRHLDLGLQLGPWQAANWVLPYTARPWEHEAHFLSGSSSGHR